MQFPICSFFGMSAFSPALSSGAYNDPRQLSATISPQVNRLSTAGILVHFSLLSTKCQLKPFFRQFFDAYGRIEIITNPFSQTNTKIYHVPR